MAIPPLTWKLRIPNNGHHTIWPWHMCFNIWCFLKWVYPNSWMVYFMENPSINPNSWMVYFMENPKNGWLWGTMDWKPPPLTVVPWCHGQDKAENLHLQICGRKTFLLIPPDQTFVARWWRQLLDVEKHSNEDECWEASVLTCAIFIFT